MSCIAYVWFKLLKNFIFDTSGDKITLVGTIFSYLRFLLNTLSWISVRLNWKSPPCTYIETGGGGWGAIEISGHVARLFPLGKISCICATFFLSRFFIQRVAFWRIPRILCHVPRFVFSVVRRERIGGSASTILPTSSFAYPSIFRVSRFFVALSVCCLALPSENYWNSIPRR